MFYRGKCIYVLYTDDTLLFGADKNEVQQVIKDLRGENLKLTVEGTVGNFLGVSVKRSDSAITLSQPLLISQILQKLHMTGKVSRPPSTPMNPKEILHSHA